MFLTLGEYIEVLLGSRFRFSSPCSGCVVYLWVVERVCVILVLVF